MDGDSYHDGDGKDAHSFGPPTGQKKQGGGESTESGAKPALKELVGGEHLPTEIVRKKDGAEDDARKQISENQLEKAEVAAIGEPGYADDGEGAGLCGD